MYGLKICLWSQALCVCKYTKIQVISIITENKPHAYHKMHLHRMEVYNN